MQARRALFKKKPQCIVLFFFLIFCVFNSAAGKDHPFLDKIEKSDNNFADEKKYTIKKDLLPKNHIKRPEAQPVKRARPIIKIMHLWETSYSDAGGVLLFSDSPEYVKTSGILYEDSVVGEGRILYYHLNDSFFPKKIAVLLTNEENSYAEVKITRGGTAFPQKDFLRVGKMTQIAYFNKPYQKNIELPPYGVKIMTAEMEKYTLAPGELVYGVYDFVTTGKVKFTVLCYPHLADPVKFVKKSSILPKDKHRLRGTFQGMNRTIRTTKVYNPEKDGMVFFPLGDDFLDPYKEGIDATDGMKALNYGNYGILYNIIIPTVPKGDVRVLLSPLGGVYAGAMRHVRNKEKGTLLLTPCHRFFFGDSEGSGTPACGIDGKDYFLWNTEYTDLGTYSGEENIHFEFSPPGASNLPVRIILEPAEKEER